MLVFMILGGMIGTMPEKTEADDLLVFISAFAPGQEGAIHSFRFEPATGALKALERTTDAEHPFFMALSPDKRSLYAIHAPGKFGGEDDEYVAAYEVLGRTGQLKLLNRQSSMGRASCYLEVTALGAMVLVANYSSGSVVAIPRDGTGRLGEPKKLIQHEGSSIDPQRQTGPFAHCIVVGPDNRLAFAADLGIDKILCYRLTPATTGLEPHTYPFVRTPPGAGPRHLTFDPRGAHMYVINELANSVTMFDYDSHRGLLTERQTISTLPEDFDGTSHCADVKITPDGRFLYGTNRGHDSIAAYAIGNDGRLALRGFTPSRGAGPQNLAITPGGKYLLCANMPGDNVVVFRIDPETGALSSVGDPISMPKPSCILID
jgi:6-phosphogluconolactonase